MYQFVIATKSSDEEGATGAGFALVDVSEQLFRDLSKLESAFGFAQIPVPDLYGLEQFDNRPDFYQTCDDPRVTRIFDTIDDRAPALMVLAEPLLLDLDVLSPDYGLIQIHMSAPNGLVVSWEMNIRHTSVIVTTARIPLKLFLDAWNGKLNYKIGYDEEQAGETE